MDTFGTLVRGVQAFTLVAIFRFHRLCDRSAAVTAVIVARFLIVTVITVTVTLVWFQRTNNLAALALRVLACAFRTVHKLFWVVVMTAITAIEGAIFVVVFVVAIRVTLVVGACAREYSFVAVTTFARTPEAFLEDITCDI